MLRPSAAERVSAWSTALPTSKQERKSKKQLRRLEDGIPFPGIQKTRSGAVFMTDGRGRNWGEMGDSASFKRKVEKSWNLHSGSY